MTYNLTITIRDERGCTKVKLTDVSAEKLQWNPLLTSVVDLHELSLDEAKKERL